MRILSQDVRVALRRISRSPGFTAIVVATLGLGIGSAPPVYSLSGGIRMAAAVALLLVMACVNSANLLVARGLLRRKELTVRTALGARRSSLFRLMLTESVLLALFGGAAGLLLAWWGVDLLSTFAPPSATGLHFVINARLLGFILAISVSSGVLFGLEPALECLRPASPQVQLLGGANLVAIAQVALAAALLVGAGSLRGQMPFE